MSLEPTSAVNPPADDDLRPCIHCGKEKGVHEQAYTFNSVTGIFDIEYDCEDGDTYEPDDRTPAEHCAQWQAERPDTLEEALEASL